MPPDLNVPSVVRAVVPYEEVKREWAEGQPVDQMPKENETEAEAQEALERHRDNLRKRVQRMRESLSRFNILDAGSIRDKDGKKIAVMWWTGKPLRGFPHTLPIDDPGASPDYDNDKPIPF